jgi:transposase
MYIDSSTVRKNGKPYTRHLLRTSFRQAGKVKHKTVANLSDCTEQEVGALRLALKHKKDLAALGSVEDIKTKLGKRFGAAWTLSILADRTGITKALGNSRDGKLALLQVLARTIGQGSRLSTIRLAMSHALCEVLGIDSVHERNLYDNLTWLAEQQERIEKKLFKLRCTNAATKLFLYDVTSCYLEGECNELATWGYNRDRKNGKTQIVVGLLTDSEGLPVAVRVFPGNTNDTKTVAEQVRIVARQFGVTEVTLVGDRGMIKGPQIDALPKGFRYITAIGKPQILKMLRDGTLQADLFDKQVCEVQQDEERYVLRRNAVRADQVAATRADKVDSLKILADSLNQYLEEHPRASASKSLQKLSARISKLQAGKWLKATLVDRTITIDLDDAALAEAALLDGCYVIKSDVPSSDASAQTLHDRYCDLESVERCFRTMKTVHLEMRPVYVRSELNTKGHVFVVMLALLLQRRCEECWRQLNVTVEEALDELGAIPLQQIHVGDTLPVNRVPEPNELGGRLLEAAAVELPAAFPDRSARVHTNKPLASARNVA